MSVRRLIICLALCSGVFCKVNAQQETSRKQEFSIHISILDESISVPNFWFLRYSYNPAVIVGTEYLLKERDKYDWHLTGNAGFFHHKNWQTALFLFSEIAYRRKLNKWSIYQRLGAGYSHAFVARPIYKFKDTQFRQASNTGSPFLMTSLSLNLSYQLIDKERSPSLYFSFMMLAMVPFDDWTGLHQFVGVGYKFFPFKIK